jgi:hypothetical protein
MPALIIVTLLLLFLYLAFNAQPRGRAPVPAPSDDGPSWFIASEPSEHHQYAASDHHHAEVAVTTTDPGDVTEFHVEADDSCSSGGWDSGDDGGCSDD